MSIPFISALPLAIKLITKILPSKPKEVIEKMVTSVIATNPDIQAELNNERQFILDYFGLKFIIKAVIKYLVEAI